MKKIVRALDRNVPRWLFGGAMLLLVLCAARAQDFANPGPYAVGVTVVTIDRDDGTRFGAWLVHPARETGAGLVPDPSRGPYPAVVFGHGFLAPPLLYGGTLAHLASWGFVLLAPSSALELFPDHAAYAADYSAAVSWLEGAAGSLGPRWSSMVDVSAVAAAGHSMGGGAAVLAAAADSRFKALGLLAPSLTFPVSAVDAASRVDAPTLVVAGSKDAITPLFVHAAPIFAALAGPRQLALILGGSHCGFVSAPVPPIFCDEADIELQEQLAAAHRSLVPFLLYEIGGRHDLEDAVWGNARVWQPPTLTLVDRRRAAPAGR